MDKYQKAMEDGQFTKFKDVRDSTSGSVRGKKRYMGADWVFGIERLDNIMFVKNEDFWEVANQSKCELLGIIYFHKPWKKWVWYQHPDTIMAKDCLDSVSKKMASLSINNASSEEQDGSK